MILKNEVPLAYYTAYRKALRDLKSALEKAEEFLKRCGMNNTKGTIAIIDVVLKDPSRLMLTASFEGYELPEKYYQNLKKWKKKRRENMQRRS